MNMPGGIRRVPRSHRRVMLVLLSAPVLAVACGTLTGTNERIFAAFMAGICACQAAKWTVIAVREFQRERKAQALAAFGLKDQQEAAR
jgi:hypothetical protein